MEMTWEPQEQKWVLLSMAKWAAVQAPVQELTVIQGPSFHFLQMHGQMMDGQMDGWGGSERERAFVHLSAGLYHQFTSNDQTAVVVI